MKEPNTLPKERNVVVAVRRQWNVDIFSTWKPSLHFKKHLVVGEDNLTLDTLLHLDPRYIFFPDWSWKIPAEIYEKFECVIFHMTDVPFGHGGSPLQNLIVRGIYDTKLTALRAVEKFDAGPVYMKYPVDLSYGSAQEIYKRVSEQAFLMMNEILKKQPNPVPQKGKITVFRRRKPEESEIPNNLTGRQLYDFIRMLDAEGYPLAFIAHDKQRYEFSNACLKENGEVCANVSIIKNDA